MRQREEEKGELREGMGKGGIGKGRRTREDKGRLLKGVKEAKGVREEEKRVGERLGQ